MQVADDNHAALKYFLKGFPEFSKNEFYISGESYGGIYVPTLSVRIVNDSAFNFKVRNEFLKYLYNGLLNELLLQHGPNLSKSFKNSSLYFVLRKL